MGEFRGARIVLSTSRRTGSLTAFLSAVSCGSLVLRRCLFLVFFFDLRFLFFLDLRRFFLGVSSSCACDSSCDVSSESELLLLLLSKASFLDRLELRDEQDELRERVEELRERVEQLDRRDIVDALRGIEGGLSSGVVYPSSCCEDCCDNGICESKNFCSASPMLLSDEKGCGAGVATDTSRLLINVFTASMSSVLSFSNMLCSQIFQK